jgi:hypothetical protein
LKSADIVLADVGLAILFMAASPSRSSAARIFPVDNTYEFVGYAHHVERNASAIYGYANQIYYITTHWEKQQ